MLNMKKTEDDGHEKLRNLIGFWFLGLCNHFVNLNMLSAAEDILSMNEGDNDNSSSNGTSEQCQDKITSRQCETMSTGTILLAHIIPTFLIKLTFPFFAHRIPYGLRQLVIVLCQAVSLLTVSFSKSFPMAFIGVLFASFGAGLGEITYLALSSYFSGQSIAAYAAGTGAAGITAALSYSALTEPHFAHISPRTTLLIMLIVPVLSAIVYWVLMKMPDTVETVNITKPSTFITSGKKPKKSNTKQKKGEEANEMLDKNQKKSTKSDGESESLTCGKKLRLILPLLRFMIPLYAVYYSEYLINQGILQMILFQCSQGFNLSPASQYRWFQVMYQLGVLISRTSIFFFTIPTVILPIFAALQLCNLAFALTESIFTYLPHIGILFAIILYEGLLGGLTYANSFHAIHETIPKENREFSLSMASAADSSGIVSAAFSAIPLHNFICNQAMK